MSKGHLVRPDGTINTGKAQHTAGPWKVFEDTIQTGPRLFSTKIAEVCTQNENKDHWKANARLIAAAPELLEMVKNLKMVLAGYMADSEVAMSTDYTLLEQADKLVAKVN